MDKPHGIKVFTLFNWWANAKYNSGKGHAELLRRHAFLIRIAGGLPEL